MEGVINFVKFTSISKMNSLRFLKYSSIASEVLAKCVKSGPKSKVNVQSLKMHYWEKGVIQKADVSFIFIFLKILGENKGY